MDGIDLSKTFGLSKNEERMMLDIFNGKKTEMSDVEKNNMIRKISTALTNTSNDKAPTKEELKKRLRNKTKMLSQRRKANIKKTMSNNIFENNSLFNSNVVNDNIIAEEIKGDEEYFK